LLDACREVDQHQSSVNEVVGVLFKPSPQGISANHLDVTQAPPLQLCSCHIEETRFPFNADDGPAGADALGQQIHDPDWAAAEINNAIARFDRHLVQQRSGMGFESLRLQDESFLLGMSATKNIGDR
jgi:hypothetical protein